MLTETFVASVGNATGAVRHDGKDAGIFVIDHLPTVVHRASLKKSASPRNCLAVSEDHIFAAQADKAVVNVYSREKGSQEAIVPFTEKIGCIALACNGTVLVLGTAEGRLFFWETCSGRQLATAQSHLQPVTGLAVDAVSSLIVSISADATAHVWSVTNLLAFQTSFQSTTPLRTFNAHRSAIVDVALGHSVSAHNFALTVSEDRNCLIWDLDSCSILITILLSSVPSCIQIEPADRAAYFGHADGSLQQVNLLNLGSNGSRRITSSEPVQPGDDQRWTIPSNTHGGMLSLAISFDSTKVLSGHESGAILVWEVGNGHVRQLPIHPPVTSPVTNIQILPVTGFGELLERSFRMPTVIKPRFGAFQNAGIDVPGDYALQLHISKTHEHESFNAMLTSATLPQAWLDVALEQLNSHSSHSAALSHASSIGHSDFMALDDNAAKPSLAKQNHDLRDQLASLRRVQMASFDQIEKLSMEKRALLQREQHRLQKLASLESTGNDDSAARIET